jgi:hypothetical protein
MLSLEALGPAFTALGPREAWLLRRRFLEQAPLEAVAAELGVPLEAAQRHQGRALRALGAGVMGRAAAPLSDAEERTADDDPALLQALAAHREGLQGLLRRQALDEAQHVERNERWRWFAIITVLALSAWFWWQQHEVEHPRLEARPGGKPPP